MLMVMGPHGGVGNFPRLSEFNANFVTELLRYAKARGVTRMEATPEAEDEWFEHVVQSGVGLLSNEIDSWMTGVNRNVDGKSVRKPMRYSGGFPAFKQYCDEVASKGYAGIKFD